MRAFVKLAAVAAVVFAMTSGPAFAAGPQQSATEFFSDESETTTVGWTILYCDGTHQHVGSYSIYSETFEFTCP